MASLATPALPPTWVAHAFAAPPSLPAACCMPTLLPLPLALLPAALAAAATPAVVVIVAKLAKLAVVYEKAGGRVQGQGGRSGQVRSGQGRHMFASHGSKHLKHNTCPPRQACRQEEPAEPAHLR